MLTTTTEAKVAQLEEKVRNLERIEELFNIANRLDIGAFEHFEKAHGGLNRCKYSEDEQARVRELCEKNTETELKEKAAKLDANGETEDPDSCNGIFCEEERWISADTGRILRKGEMLDISGATLDDIKAYVADKTTDKPSPLSKEERQLEATELRKCSDDYTFVNAETARHMRLGQEMEALGITLDDLHEVASLKRRHEFLMSNDVPPKFQLVKIGKPNLAPLSIAAAYEEYINHCVIAKNMSPKTIRHWKYMQKLAVVYFSGEANEHTGKHKPINSIQELDYSDALDFQKYLATWLRQDTVRQTMTRLRCVIDWFDARGYDVIKSKFINVPKHEKHEVECLDLKEVREFIDVVAEPHANLSEQGRLRNVAICELLFSSGIRVSEAERLDRDSIKNRMFNVVQGKSKKGRPCFISKRAEKAIKTYLDTRTDHCKALFISTEADKRLSAQAMRHIFVYACKVSRFVGIHPHTFRHSFATYMLNHGADLITLARMLGHEDVQTTQLYTHVTDPQLRIVHERIMARI